MEKMDYVNAFLLNKYALLFLVLMVLVALSTTPGIPTTTPLPDPF